MLELFGYEKSLAMVCMRGLCRSCMIACYLIITNSADTGQTLPLAEDELILFQAVRVHCVQASNTDRGKYRNINRQSVFKKHCYVVCTVCMFNISLTNFRRFYLMYYKHKLLKMNHKLQNM